MFVQKRLALQATAPSVECPQEVTEQQQSRPVEDVIAESYPEDGFCTFASLEPGFSVKDILDVPQATPFTFVLPDGRKIATRDHEYPWDDIWCLANGFYELPRHELASNFTFLEEVSDKACEDVKNTLGTHYHTLTIQNLTNPRNDELVKQMQTAASEKKNMAHVSPATILDAKERLAIECMMRGGGGKAICDIALCAARGCWSPDGQMLYSTRGECIDA
eukprot:Skav226640  [mRNA]  locus=scaffold1450:137984:138819:+ [translate_table: standard]